MAFKKAFGRNDLTEICNLSELKKFIKNWDTLEERIDYDDDDDDEKYNPLLICKKYLAGYKNDLFQTKYSKSGKYPTKLGRWFCKNGVGIQSLPRVIRHTICKGLWIDLDFKNCHPVILSQLCKKHNINCEHLDSYINNREELLEKWAEQSGNSKDKMKKAFLKALNGNKSNFTQISRWSLYTDEFKNIHETIAKLPENKTLLEEVEELETKNVYAKVCNRILCNVENKCLEVLYQNLDKRKLLNYVKDDIIYKVCSLIFDGLQIPDNERTRQFIADGGLNTISIDIEDTTDFKLDIVIKEFDECVDLSEYDENTDNEDDHETSNINDDVDACEVIIRKYGHMMVGCNNVRYVKKNNIWTCNETIVSSTIYNWIVNTPMKLKVSDKKNIMYNRDKVCIKKCLDVVMNTAFVNDNPTFITENLVKSKDYLPFKNGIYSLRDKKLYSYDEIDIQFTQQIDRDFPKQNDNQMKELMERVIEPIFPNEEERKYFFFILSRALAGRYEDKKWFINRGSRNSGKGVITKMLQNSFQKFVGTFNSGAFVVKQFQNADDAKNLSWVCGKRDCRLIISNEVKEKTVLDGVLIKSLSSGGDTILARTNHKDEFEFVPQFLMMFMLNDIKGVEPADALENCEQFYCKSKFVKKEDLIEGQPFLKLRDENIKGFIETPEAIDSFTLYVLHHFQDQLQVPESVKLSTQAMTEDTPLTLEQTVLKYFRSSPNNKDRLFTEDIIKHIDACGYHGSVNTKELSSILQKCSIGTRTKNGSITINKVKLNGYTNIVFVPPEVSNDDEEE
jgi:hypothetical protein